MSIAKFIRLITKDSGDPEKNIRTIPSAEVSMMEGLSEIPTPSERRKAVDRMIANAKRYANQGVQNDI